MGYHVEIDESSKHLLRMLSKRPEDIFGKRYVGYLLFLATEHDREQLDWVVKNAPDLDSLTGNHLAYAVFAKRFPVKLKVQGGGPKKRPPANIGELGIENFRKQGYVNRLVENGQFGEPFNGDELTAITYGTDIVAKELGLIDQLPCLVVLDAIPSDQPLVIELNNEILPTLFQLIRGAVSRFEKSKKAQDIRRDVATVTEIESCINVEQIRDKKLRDLIAKKQSNIFALSSKIDNGVVTRDPGFFQEKMELEKSRIEELKRDLEDFPIHSKTSLSNLNAELMAAMNRYQSNSEGLITKCMEKELLSRGLKNLVKVGKVESLSFLSYLFKPQTLIKLWSLGA